MLLANRELMNDTRIPHETVELAGNFRFRWLVTLPRRRRWRPSSAICARSRAAARARPAPYFVLSNPVEQHLMLTGTAFFIGLGFQDLRRMQLDIETYTSSGFEYASAGREGDRITAIAITDSAGFERVLDGHAMTSARCSRSWCGYVARARPRRDQGPQPVPLRPGIPEERARRHKLKLALGPTAARCARASRLQIASARSPTGATRSTAAR